MDSATRIKVLGRLAQSRTPAAEEAVGPWAAASVGHPAVTALDGVNPAAFHPSSEVLPAFRAVQAQEHSVPPVA